MKFIKKTILLTTISFVSLSALVLFLGFIYSNTDLGLEEQDKSFMSAIGSSLQKVGDQVDMRIVFAEPWQTVCPIAPYARVSKVVAAQEGIPREQVEILNTHDEVASDALWGYAFIYASGKVKYFRVSEKQYFYDESSACTHRDQAVLELTEKSIQTSTPYLALTSK